MTWRLHYKDQYINVIRKWSLFFTGLVSKVQDFDVEVGGTYISHRALKG
jgi:hypothetical protein